MNTDGMKPRYLMLRFTPGSTSRPVQTVDVSYDHINGVRELLETIENYIHDDIEGTVYSVVAAGTGEVQQTRRIEVAKRAVTVWG